MGIAMRCLFVRGSRCVSHTSLELATLAQVPFGSCQDFIRSVSSNSAVLFGTLVPLELVCDWFQYRFLG